METRIDNGILCLGTTNLGTQSIVIYTFLLLVSKIVKNLQCIVNLKLCGLHRGPFCTREKEVVKLRPVRALSKHFADLNFSRRIEFYDRRP